MAASVLIAGMPSAAAEPKSAEGDLITEFTTRVLAGKLALDPKNRKASIVDAKQLTQLVDEVGNALSPMRVSSVKARSGAPVGKYACDTVGKPNKRFVELAPSSWNARGKEGVLQYQFFPYKQGKARVRGEVLTTQWEICGTGGADLQDGYRIHQTGLGVAFPDTNRTFKIGQAWQSGKTPSDTTVGLGFEVGKAPVVINGSISQNPSDKLKGSIVGPFKTYMDDYAFNGVNAWWEDSCVKGWTRCRVKGDGSPDFQGTVVHGLWEFMPADARNVSYFLIQPYLKFACHGFDCP